RLRFGPHDIPLPSWKPLRVVLGIAFLVGGMFAILPVLGFWMIPVGVLILSIDFPPVRRLRRRTQSWYGRSALRQAFNRMAKRWGRAGGKKKGPSG
ncbi:MAG: PGPGW domain-containing protein, partial [Rhizomicrobium sp.]